MLKALARKELRELLPLALLGVALELYLACTATGMRLGFFEENSRGTIPFVSDSTTQLFYYVSGGLAFALGIYQTMFESCAVRFNSCCIDRCAQCDLWPSNCSSAPR